jgi:hypothetical protein
LNRESSNAKNYKDERNVIISSIIGLKENEKYMKCLSLCGVYYP